MVRRYAVNEGMPHTTIDGRRYFDEAACRAWMTANGKGTSLVGGKKPGAGRKKKPTAADQATRTLDDQPENEPIKIGDLLNNPEDIDSALNHPRMNRATAQQASEIYKAATAKLEYRQKLDRVVARDDVERTWAGQLQVVAMRLEDLEIGLAADLASALGLDEAAAEKARALVNQHALRIRGEMASDPLGTQLKRAG